MFDVFKQVDKFFVSITNYLTYNYIFVAAIGLFLLTVIMVIYFTSRSYEARLIKAIDHLNSYFIDNPQINEDNLVSFNAKMKSSSVPKQLRKAWQQFVLYREGKASSYMSFENCVSTPIKNSTYTRDIKIMNTLAWILSLCAFILNAYYCFDTVDFANVLRTVLLTPIIILLINFIVQIFLNLRHHAIISDLFQNYQYFEANIDKATETLPEYVDYEVLFDRSEIKKGIPILYAYLQKRAEEEQRQLEIARLKNVEHEKFNFDDQGIAASLVLERAMHEAENYIAERKKYMQDTEQINADMTQEDLNYREITKEYNRQMQVSKETFANFKTQLEEASSSIEANYLKKQQQQELDRQRNLERDFDTATERHKKVIEGFNAELDSVDKLIAESRKNLEEAMKSEFASYSSKVYDEAKLAVDKREKEKTDKFKTNISNLEETLIQKNEELERLYAENQKMSDKLLEIEGAVSHEDEKTNKKRLKEVKQEQPAQVEEVAPVGEYKPLTYEETEYKPAYEREDYTKLEPKGNETNRTKETEEEPEDGAKNIELDDLEKVENEKDFNFEDKLEDEAENDDEMFDFNFKDNDEDDNIDEISDESESPADFEDDKETKTDDNQETYNELMELRRLLEERANLSKNSTVNKGDSINTAVERGTTAIQGEKRKVGRPRKEVVEIPKVKRGRGRPRKASSSVAFEPKKQVGRPRKEETQQKQGRGRPRKESVEIPKVKKGRGRPRKASPSVVVEAKKQVGRPRNEKIEVQEVKKGRGRPPKDAVDLNNIKNIKDIDQYLKEIDNQIAVENAKLQESQKELDKKSKIRK